MKQRELGELIIEDGKKRIILSMDKKKYLGWHTNEAGEIVDKLDDNQIEISYREDDEEGWGAGGDEYFSTYDIKAMADSIRSVILFKQSKADYSCQDDIFRMSIEYNADKECFSFTAAIIETLMREYHISITKTALTRKSLDKYIQPFFEWEKMFPICRDQVRK